MDNIYMYVPTKIYFGKDQIQNLPDIVNQFGKKVLLVYGGGSIKKSGLYDTITGLLNENNIEFKELSGVEPNPRITSVREGVKICRENGLDLVLGVGGGSVFDCSKAIAAAVAYDGDAWDLVTAKAPVTKVLPVVVVSTLAATGSEMDTSAVISDIDLKAKLGFSHADMRPRAAILDPTYTMTVPPYHTAAGTADIIAHVFEYYFNNTPSAYWQNRMQEAFLKTCFEYGHKAYNNPNDYEARANLLLASAWALTGIIGKGFPIMWTTHMIEHELSAYYDITHGVGLAILIPPWLRFCARYEHTMPKFQEYAKNIWNIDIDSMTPAEAAELSIQKTEEYFAAMNLPKTLGELGITDEYFEEMAKNIMDHVGPAMKNCFVALDVPEIVEILNMSL